jgi:hypothetical protein
MRQVAGSWAGHVTVLAMLVSVVINSLLGSPGTYVAVGGDGSIVAVTA